MLDRPVGAAADADNDRAHAVFAHALKRIAGAARAYDRGIRTTASNPEHVDAPRYCQAVLADALSDRLFLQVAQRRRFFVWAQQTRPTLKFLPVLSAVDLLARGERRAAKTALDRALALNQDDLHAQNLWLDIEHQGKPRPDFRGRFCSHPFERLESQTEGRALFCCPAWLPSPIGDLETVEDGGVWNSSTAQDIRASIHDGSYRYCSRMHCPLLTADNLPKTSDLKDARLKDIAENKRVVLADGPQRMSLSHDRSCQLSCPSCRTKTIMARSDEAATMNAMAERAILPLLKGARKVVVTGAGDGLASKHYRWLLAQLDRRRYPELRVTLQTNGLLLKKHWDDLDLEGRVSECLVSLDAVEPETYAVLRRGGAFEDLYDNLLFLSDLRRDGRVQRVRLDFVTQAMNFRQMPEAAALMRRLGFDGVKFQMIRSWGTYAPEEFARHHIGSPQHPEYPAFLATLEDRRLGGEDVEFYGFYGAAGERAKAQRATLRAPDMDPYVDLVALDVAADGPVLAAVS